ncbi:hypothetical protein [Paracoccus sp. SCSIO 75233]|uniref:hypothetical protein n=1 Tax=Paracoccus sp. SCSIO 75233 TaxID=3017782 RepID=UPI0022F05475|nr:hypothetical protein [Paracoccus sp. SCSIO 75233]WBU55430.1 hypothetical protein PAF12_18870 [Paracoccus sp. SCSIO 75233]
MNLFNRKTLARHIKPASLPADHLAALEAWTELIRDGRIYSLKEVALHGQFTSKIVESVLGYHGPAGGAEYARERQKEIMEKDAGRDGQSAVHKLDGHSEYDIGEDTGRETRKSRPALAGFMQ